MLSALLQALVFHGLLAHAQSSFQLGYIPLTVKTPYLNGWIVSNTGSSPEQAWPNFYTTEREFGWAGMIRVDNQPFQWMGNSGFNFTKTLSSYITPTKSVFTIQAGPMMFNVTFLSTIELDDYVRQSMPFTYMYLDAFSANDSQPHSLQVYSDISGQWAALQDATPVQWDTTQDTQLVYHHVVRQSPQPMMDDNDFAEDGTAYYGMLQRSGMTWQTGEDIILRGGFATGGQLNNTKDTSFRDIGPTDWPVFGFAVDLGTVSPGSQPDPLVWALGFVRNPLVTYTTESAVQSRSGYYFSTYGTVDAAISAFLSDFTAAQQRNAALDNKIMNDANAISSEYAGVVALVTRSLFASMDITVPVLNGNYNTSDVRIFMKDMGSSTRANPVEVIYGAFPALIYFNATLAGGLLEPLLEFQSGASYKNPYAAPDLGGAYPVILGNNSDTHQLAVESSGSMLIMAYAHAVKSGDGSLINRYYSTLQQWADYLVTNALNPPPGSVSADGLSNPAGLSNLALKGILGIYCMGKIDEALGVPNTTFMDQATQLIAQWKTHAVSNGHIQTVYGQSTSSGLIYNLFPAIWLGMDLVDNATINNQAQFYAQESSAQYILDSSEPDVVFPHWVLMTAATIPSSLASIQGRLISSVNQYMYTVANKFPLPMTYQASTGNRITGSGSAIHGASFSMLALNIPNVAIQANPLGTSSSKKNVGAIAGGTIGGIAGALAIASAIFFWRRRKQKQEARSVVDAEHKPRPFDPAATPSTHIINPNGSTNGRSSSSEGLSVVTPFQYQRVPNNALNDSTAQLSGTGATVPQNHWIPEQSDGGAQTRFPVGGAAGASPVETVSSSSLPPGAAPPMSAKRREALANRRYHAVAPSESAVSTLSNPYSPPESATGSGSGTEDLRAELVQLRREMDSIRHMAEPPPGYD